MTQILILYATSFDDTKMVIELSIDAEVRDLFKALREQCHYNILIKKIYLNLPFSAINDLLGIVLFFKPETIRLGDLDKRR